MIIEFAGTPRSGKSSTIETVRDYFDRSHEGIVTIGEAAQDCPFSHEHRVAFSTWSANKALTCLLNAHHAAITNPKNKVFLQDRGLFDALAFYKLLEIQGFIDEQELENFLSFFGSDRFTNLVDLVLLFEVSPKEALLRDQAYQIFRLPGIITNHDTLRQLADAYGYILDRYGRSFPLIIRINTTDRDEKRTAEKIVDLIIKEKTKKEYR